MKLNSIYQGVISLIEPIPTGASELTKISILERGAMRVGKTVTDILKSLRPGQPMNWDPWILKDGDLYRMFYLQGVEGHTPWWTVSNLCGAVSPDLDHWDDLGVLLAPNPECAIESGRISAGCAVKENDTLYLFYSAGGKEGRELKSEAIGLATSTDGIHWQRRYDHFPLMPADHDPWYGRCNWTNHFHWRDPYIFKDENAGLYYMLTCASSKTPGNFQGCVGLAVADKIDGPYQLLPPIVAASSETASDWAFYHMERPQLIYRNHQYYLFFSCFRMFLNPQWVKQKPFGRITNSSLHCYVSDRITGPFVPVKTNDGVIPGSETSGLYGTNLLEIEPGTDRFLAYGWYHRLHTLGVSPTFEIRWTNNGYRMQKISQTQRNLSQTLPAPMQSTLPEPANSEAL